MSARINEFFSEFVVGKFYDTDTGETNDVNVINVDNDTGVAIIYILGKFTGFVGCFTFAKKREDGMFVALLEKDRIHAYSNVGTFGHRPRKVLTVDLGRLCTKSKHRVLEMVNGEFHSLESIDKSVVIGDFYFDRLSENKILVREFKD